ncbi:hypothetical protein CALCODRAFT_552758 [Calocera cornea HHB12733]|uniref:Uncharacterized protein n=1 Tax=Calocera cornea HHB12733 TaxID=1353952 RepID=A0A165JS19_9BASI|nr:hypothetical protein CALCODRAFT_552758 [Calocera cornea HHB12733]
MVFSFFKTLFQGFKSSQMASTSPRNVANVDHNSDSFHYSYYTDRDDIYYAALHGIYEVPVGAHGLGFVHAPHGIVSAPHGIVPAPHGIVPAPHGIVPVHPHLGFAMSTLAQPWAGRGSPKIHVVPLMALTQSRPPINLPPNRRGTASPTRSVSPKRALGAELYEPTRYTPLKRQRDEEDLNEELPPATRQTMRTVADTTRRRNVVVGPSPEGLQWETPHGIVTSGPLTLLPTWEEAMAGARPFDDEWNAKLEHRMALHGFPKGAIGSTYTQIRCEEEERLRLEREREEQDEHISRAYPMMRSAIGFDLDAPEIPGPSRESEMLEESSSRASSEESIDPRLPILQDHLAAVGAVPPPPPAPPLPSPPGTPTSELSDLPPLPDMGDLPPLVASTQPPSTQPRVPRSHGESASGGLSHENPIGAPSSAASVHPVAAERSFAALPKRAAKGRGAPQTTTTTVEGRRGSPDPVNPIPEPSQPQRIDKGKKRAVEDDSPLRPDASPKRQRLDSQSPSPAWHTATESVLRRARNSSTHSGTGSWASGETSARLLEQSSPATATPPNAATFTAGTSGPSSSTRPAVPQGDPHHSNAQADAQRMGYLMTRPVHRERHRHIRVDANFMVQENLVHGRADDSAVEADRSGLDGRADGRASATNTTVVPWVEDEVRPVSEPTSSDHAERDSQEEVYSPDEVSTALPLLAGSSSAPDWYEIFKNDHDATFNYV